MQRIQKTDGGALPPVRRNTAQRRLVYEAVLMRNDHPSADEIYLDVNALDPRISRATVYRNLNLLAERGELRHVKLPAGPDRFDWRLEDHNHAMCVRCQRVIDLELPYDGASDACVADETGFLITRHRTVFEGLCPDCR